MPVRKLCELLAMFDEGGARLHYHKLRSAFRCGFEYASEVVSWVHLERLHLQIERLCPLLGRGELVGTLCVIEHRHPVAVRKHLPQEVNLLSGQVEGANDYASNIAAWLREARHIAAFNRIEINGKT